MCFCFASVLLQSYINEPLKKRREVLRQHFHTVDGQFYFATYKDT